MASGSDRNLMNSELRWEKAKPSKIWAQIPLAIPINHAVFMVRLQPHCHLDFLTLTFISESFPNIGSQLNPSFHLSALPGCQFWEEWPDFWRGRNVMCGRARRNPGNSCVTWSYKRKKTYFAWKATSAERNLRWSQGVESTGRSAFQLLVYN